MADPGKGEVITGAPLIVKDMVVTGMAGAEFGVRGWIEALDLKTGKRRWRTYTIPGPGEPGHETWKDKLRRLEDRRRHHVGHRLLRSRAEPDRLGHGQSRSRLGQRLSSRRQPVDRQHASRSMPTPARSSGASSTRRTIRTTTTRSPRTPSSIPTSTASSCGPRCMPTAMDSPTRWIARPASSCGARSSSPS